MSEQLLKEISNLRSKIAKFEENEINLKNTEEELNALNQQLDASNQQLLASEQQLRALNEQLKANEEELIAKEEYAQQVHEYAENIIATIRTPFVILDKKLHVLTVSHSFCDTYKVTQEETIGKLFYKLGNNQWNIPSLKKLLKDILPGKSEIKDFEVNHNFEKIGYKTMLLNAREVIRGENKHRLIFISIEDITLRQQTLKKLNQLNIELENRKNELQQVLYITTHDLRSPLVNIQGFNKELGASLEELNNLLEEIEIPNTYKKRISELIEEEIPESMHFITSSSNKMDALLKGLLSLSRLGRQKVVFKDVDMNELMTSVIDNFEYEIIKNKVEVHISDLPQCIGDEFQLNQLFSNLLGNALKFFDSDRPGIINISGEKINNYIKYKVQDNGIGIHPDHQDKVFELFHKLDPKKPGIGLGMNIVKQIVEKHKGKIEVESEPGAGTKFIISLPIDGKDGN